MKEATEENKQKRVKWTVFKKPSISSKQKIQQQTPFQKKKKKTLAANHEEEERGKGREQKRNLK